MLSYRTHSEGNRRLRGPTGWPLATTCHCLMLYRSGRQSRARQHDRMGSSIRMFGEGKAVPNVILFIGDGMGHGQIEAARNASPFMLTIDFMPRSYQDNHESGEDISPTQRGGDCSCDRA